MLGSGRFPRDGDLYKHCLGEVVEIKATFIQRHKKPVEQSIMLVAYGEDKITTLEDFHSSVTVNDELVPKFVFIKPKGETTNE